MLTIMIGGLGFVVLYCMIRKGSWLGAGIVVAIMIFLWLCSSQEREDTKAYFNWRDYWANGGPNGKRTTRR